MVIRQLTVDFQYSDIAEVLCCDSVLRCHQRVFLYSDVLH